MLKDPESLTEGQAAALDAPKSMGTALWRGHLLKEAFRAVFRAQGEEAEEEEGKGAPGGAGVGLPTHRNSRSLH